MRTTTLLALALLGLFARPAGAEDATWEDRLQAYLAEDDAEKRLTLLLGVLPEAPADATLLDRLAAPRAYDADAPTGTIEWERRAADLPVTVYAHVPEDYTPETAWPVLLWLHGGVSRPADGSGAFAVQNFGGQADAGGFFVLSPSGREGVEWWTPAGVEHVRASLKELGRRYRIDADRVAVGGFSDGASGCFHLLAHDPDPYACFLAFMAHPGLTRMAGGPTWRSNVLSRPVYATNGGRDQLYPSEGVKPYIDELKEVGCDLTWTDLPEAGHDMRAILPLWTDVLAFWKDHPRDAAPETVAWSTSLPEREGRRAWIQILRTVGEADADVELRPKGTARPRLGVRIDTEHRGAGLRVEAVEPDTPAAASGFEPGDVIVEVDGEALPEGRGAFTALREFLEGLGEEDGAFTVMRGEERLTIETRPRVLAQDTPRPPELGYDRPVGHVEARALGGGRYEITSKGVSRLRLHLVREQATPGEPVVVVWNGRTVHDATPAIDPSYALAEAATRGAGAPLAWAYLDLARGP